MASIMKPYDRARPLIFIHIPKAAGTSTRHIFQQWFGSNFRKHYVDEKLGRPPVQLDLTQSHSSRTPVLLYGHFNRQRGFGIAENYPHVDQFVTILRDPFDSMVSFYHFVRRVSDTWKDKSQVPDEDLKSFLLNARPFLLDHFPRELTLNNYETVLNQYFVEIGVVEKLSESMDRIATKLGFVFQRDQLKHLNQRQWQADESVEDLREEFMAKHPLEYRVYEFAAPGTSKARSHRSPTASCTQRN